MKVTFKTIVFSEGTSDREESQLIRPISTCCKDFKDWIGPRDFLGGGGRLPGYVLEVGRISFCPFCGERLEYVEVERVRRTQRKVKKIVEREVTEEVDEPLPTQQPKETK